MHSVRLDGNLGADLLATGGDYGAASEEMEDGRWLLLMRAPAGWTAGRQLPAGPGEYARVSPTRSCFIRLAESSKRDL